MTPPWKVLVLSAGDNTGVNFCRALALLPERYYVIATDTNLYRLHNATGNTRYLLPPPSPDYMGALQRLIDRERPDLLYASDTNPELEIVTSGRDYLGCRTFWPSQEALNIYEDKWATYEKCRDAGLPVPDTVLLQTPRDVEECIRRWGKVWLRATRGSGGRGAIVTDDEVLAAHWVQRFDGWGTFTAAEVLTPTMATWIGVWWHGELVACQGRRRLHWEYAQLSPTGVTGITGAQSTISDAKLDETASAAILATGFVPHGIVSVDFTYDRRGRPNVTEIQAARFYSSVLFLAVAGLNLPSIYVDLGITGEVPALPQRLNPLPDDLIWLKAVDCLPRLMTNQELEERRSEWQSY
jgi:hypothetical protein